MTGVLLFAKDIPQEWPSPYSFKNPALLHRGSILSVTSHSAAVKVTVSRYQAGFTAAERRKIVAKAEGRG
jgi:hypothetical protein